MTSAKRYAMPLPKARAAPHTVDHGPSDAADLMRFPMLAALPEEARAGFLPLLLRRRMRRRATLDGALLNDRVALIWSGRYRLMSKGRAGRRTNLMSLSPGQIAGLERLGVGSRDEFVEASLHADEAGIILTMTHRHFMEIADAHPMLWREVAFANGFNAMLAGKRLHEIAAHGVHDRVLAYLQRAAARHEQSRIAPPPRHVDIAADIGASREAVTRAMKMLADQALVDLRRDFVTVVTRARAIPKPALERSTTTTPM